MKILLRETDNRVCALDPDSGEALTRIPTERAPVWCDNDNLSTDYDHANGIYWNTWAEAEAQLSEHEIIRD